MVSWTNRLIKRSPRGFAVREIRRSTKILARWPITLHRDLFPIPDLNSSAKGLMRMPVGRHNSGPLWVDGSIVLRVRDKKHRAWRMVKVRRPYAVVGRHPKADLVIDRDDVADHHVFLFLDSRGLFGVDLRTDRGTRFAGSDAEASWLGSGDLIEVGDSTIEVIQLRVNGSVVSGPLSNDDPLGLVDASTRKPRQDLTLQLLDDPGANWSIGSSLVFLGRGPACAVHLADDQVAATHAAILRDGSAVYFLNFPGEISRINGEAAGPAVRLSDSDVLAIGDDSLLVRTHELSSAPGPDHFESFATRLETVVGPDHFADAGFSFEDHRLIRETNPVDYPALIGRLQAETATLVAILLRRIEALDEEMASLRDRLDAEDREKVRATGPPVEKLRWDLIPPPDPEAENGPKSGFWLVDRLRELETERRATWSNLLSRIGPRKPPS